MYQISILAAFVLFEYHHAIIYLVIIVIYNEANEECGLREDSNVKLKLTHNYYEINMYLSSMQSEILHEHLQFGFSGNF